MTPSRKTWMIAGAAATAVAAATLGAGPSSAADGKTQTTLYTLANGPCAGTVDVGVGRYPSQAVLFLQSNLLGVGPCSVDLTYTFTPRAGGPSKKFTRHIVGPGVWGTSRDIVSPGKPGIYDVTVSTNAPSVGATKMTIDIQPYRG